jgi:hypothetical protein
MATHTCFIFSRRGVRLCVAALPDVSSARHRPAAIVKNPDEIRNFCTHHRLQVSNKNFSGKEQSIQPGSSLKWIILSDIINLTSSTNRISQHCKTTLRVVSRSYDFVVLINQHLKGNN